MHKRAKLFLALEGTGVHLIKVANEMPCKACMSHIQKKARVLISMCENEAKTSEKKAVSDDLTPSALNFENRLLMQCVCGGAYNIRKDYFFYQQLSYILLVR